MVTIFFSCFQNIHKSGIKLVTVHSAGMVVVAGQLVTLVTKSDVICGGVVFVNPDLNIWQI